VRECEFVRGDSHDIAVPCMQGEHVEGECSAAGAVEVGDSGDCVCAGAGEVSEGVQVDVVEGFRDGI
jgi:hypothetical protein